MSKEKPKKDIIRHKEISISKMENFIDDFIEYNPSTADKFCYWLEDYARYLKYERIFDPKKNKSYKRGDIIKVDLGFNIGSEEGGLHYCVVLDKHNNQSSPIVTVVPLTSLKDPNKAMRKGEVSLGNELYSCLNDKFKLSLETAKSKIEDIEKQKSIIKNDLIIQLTKAFHLQNQLKEHEEKINSNDELSDREETELSNLVNEINNKIADLKNSISSLEKDVDNLENESNQCTLIIKSINAMIKELSMMKEGSLALVNQITTVSKIRIKSPKRGRDVLSGIRLSAELLDEIDNEIKKLFTNF